MAYDHISLEKKWQKFWADNQVFKTLNDSGKPKKYILDMFPYPSGAGLHVGHPKGYTATDIVSRYYHAKGYNVLHPMGWDAFGLPAENYAIKTGTHPAITTAENIATFTSQMKNLGFSYDWDRTVDTTDPEYYKWTQWIFLELFRRGLAYEQDLPINYCPSCKTGLANEEVLSDNTCDRCGTKVERRPIRQWVLKITEYADRLLSDIDDLDWPDGIKEMQRNWIGRSEGCEFEMKKSDDLSKSIRVYTTRVDTVYGMTYAVLAPDHPKVDDFITPAQREVCEQYIETAKNKSDQDRTADNKEKTGVFTGSFVINPYNGESVPLWIADFALGHYGTGALMAVPAHDERDFEFAKKYDLPIKQSIRSKYTYTDEHKPRAGVDTVVRPVIDVILENSQGEFLLLDENNGLSVHFIGGGIEPGDGEYATIKKEIAEEAGYTDIEIIAPIDGSYCGSFGYRVPKGKNQESYGRFFHVRLLSENRVHSEVEDGRHGMKWYAKDDVKKSITWKVHADAWDIFLHGMKPTCDDGYLVQSGEHDNLSSLEARRVLTEKAEREGFGQKKVNYKLRDWLFSRQRYWGEPIPLIHISHEDHAELPLLSEKNHIPYITLGGKSTPKTNENIKYFDPVNAIVRHWSDDSYIVLTFKNGEKGLVGGSVENGETREEAIIREVQEETGYKNVRIEKIVIPEIYSRGYKERKNLEEEAKESIYLVQILDDEKAESSIEGGILSSDWISGDDVGNTITLDHHRFYWNYYRGSLAYRIQREDGEFLYINGTELSQIYDGINGKIIIESNLPLTLPEVEKYEPAGDGQSPLATVPSFVNVRLADNLSGKRETNTMPQWGGSCWYYLRYMDSKNQDALASKEALDYWGIVDEYVGGAEHAVLHLLYARFWHKVLYDAGVVPTKEPFQKLTNVGMILAYAYERADGGLVAVDLVEEREGKFFEKETGKEVKQVVAKMSKSLKNVVNPNDIVREYGADTLRLYEMSMSGFTDTAPWNPDAIIGVRRFLDRAHATFTEGRNIAKDEMKAMKLLHKTVKKVGEDIVEYKFNTAISSLMILLNEGLPTDAEFVLEWKEKFSIMLHPFAPHMAEELWSSLPLDKGGGGDFASIYSAEWPSYDEWMLVDDEVTIAVQVNGKLRGTLTCMNGVMQEEVSTLAHENPDIAKWIDGKTLVKEIFIPNKMLSIVVKD